MSGPPGEKHYGVARKLLAAPMPDPAWMNEAVCANPPEAVQGIDLPNSEAPVEHRNEDEERFIRLVCGRCCVKRDCFYSGIKSGVDDAVLGGLYSTYVSQYALAYKRLKKEAGRSGKIPGNEQG